MGNDQYNVCWIFDSGKFTSPFYGEETISILLDQKCLSENKETMFFLTGDVLDENIASDCSQIAIRDELCTISNLPGISKDWIFAVVVENIEKEIACRVDRAFSNHEAYYGMTSIDVASADPRKQFWKMLHRSFSVFKRKLTVFGSEESGLVYKRIAEDKGLEVCFSESVEEISTCDILLNMDNDQAKNKLNSNRGRLEMNFALAKEVGIAGAQIWRSIKDLDRVKVEKDTPVGENNIEYLFLAFYQAAQGIERLQKIVIELLIKRDPPKESELKSLEALLRSHNHIRLHDYIEKKRTIGIKKNSKHFLEILRIFYIDVRYGRYSYSDNNERETTLLHELGKSLSESGYDKNVKSCFGKALANLSKCYYSLIKEISHEMNIYVYEINMYCDASYVFYIDENENLYRRYKQIEQSKKELLYFLMINGKNILPKSLVDNMPALDFDTSDVTWFIASLISQSDAESDLYDFVDCEYDNLVENDKGGWKERIELIKDIDKIIDANNIQYIV